MGYELEASFRQLPRVQASQRDARALQARWLLAQQRLADAVQRYRALRGLVSPGEPAWLAAQLQLSQARLRCREIDDAIADEEVIEAG